MVALAFTVNRTLKLHSHRHLLWTSAKALAPSSPIWLRFKKIFSNEVLAFKASDAMAQGPKYSMYVIPDG